MSFVHQHIIGEDTQATRRPPLKLEARHTRAPYYDGSGRARYLVITTFELPPPRPAVRNRKHPAARIAHLFELVA